MSLAPQLGWKRRPAVTDWLLLVSIPAFFFAWKLSAFGLLGADEPRYAQVAWEMLRGHDWVTPTLGGRPWLEKPPLYYWQAMVAFRLFKESDWAARLPAALDAWLLVVGVYGFLRRFRPGSELDGALLVATTAGVIGYARAASMDMALAASFSMAMFAWYGWFRSESRGLLLAFYALLALATLAKGPVAPLLAALILAIFSASQRSFGIARKTLSGWGILVFFVLALPWYALVELRNPQFFREFIVEHNLLRFGSNLYHHREPAWYYIPVTLLGWVPWSIVVLAALGRALGRLRGARVGSGLTVFLVIWIGVILALFSISQSKLPGYVLPAIPAGAILAVDYLSRAGGNRARLWVAFFTAFLAGGLIFCALAIDPLIARHRVSWDRARIPALIGLLVAAGVFLLLARFGWKAMRASLLVTTILALGIGLRLGAARLNRDLSARPVAAELARFHHPPLPAAVFLVPRETEFGLAFYLDQVIPRYELGQVPDGEHLVVAAEGHREGVRLQAGRKAVYVGNFPGQKLDFFYVPAR